MKFKLVEDLDKEVLNEETGVRLYLGKNNNKIGGLFTETGKLLKKLWDEDNEYYDDINYHLSQLEDMFDVPDLDYKNNKYNFAFKKSFITDEVREIIDDLNLYLNEIDYEIIEETVDIPNIEYQDNNQFAYKSLDEGILNEATVPSYRYILFNLIRYLTNNEVLKEIIDKNAPDYKNLQFHHIDNNYIGVRNGLKRAVNNDATNIAIVTIEAHKELTKLNNRLKKDFDLEDEISKSLYIKKVKEEFENILNKYKDQIFPLRECLPKEVIKFVEKSIMEGEI